MTAIKESAWNVVGILGAARGARASADGPIGSEHLLAGITTARGPAREALDGEGATRTVLMAVLRDRRGRDGAWGGSDDAGAAVAATDVLGEDGDRGIRLTGAAARALTAAMRQAQREDAPKFTAVHLLRALLAEDNRAVELLGACRVPPLTVRTRLDGGTAAGHDDLDPLLHPTREVLLGRGVYRHLPLWKRWMLTFAGVNWAARPAWWAAMETYEQARRLGCREPGTEHILLAVLATHELALRHPHLAKEAAPGDDSRYAGGELLAGLGIDHAAVHRALTGGRVRLTADARPARAYLDAATRPYATSPAGSCALPAADPGTGPLIEALLHDDTRARQLIDALTPGS